MPIGNPMRQAGGILLALAATSQVDEIAWRTVAFKLFTAPNSREAAARPIAVDVDDLTRVPENRHAYECARGALVAEPAALRHGHSHSLYRHHHVHMTSNGGVDRLARPHGPANHRHVPESQAGVTETPSLPEVDMNAKQAWVLLATGVLSYELYCKDGELLSECVDEWLDCRPLLTRAVIAALALHLGNLLPARYDVVSLGFFVMRKAKRCWR